MNYSYIEQLIQRYWEGETSREEEQILRAFFAQEDVPEQLRQYAEYFSSLAEASQTHLDSQFDERMLARIEQPPVRLRPLTWGERLRPLFRAAAVVAIVVLIGSSVDSAISRHAAQREEQLNAHVTETDSISTQMETLRNIQTTIQAAVTDSLH